MARERRRGAHSRSRGSDDEPQPTFSAGGGGEDPGSGSVSSAGIEPADATTPAELVATETGPVTRRERRRARRQARKHKRSWVDRVLLAGVILVVLALVALGSGYAYLQYRFNQVAKVTVQHLKVAPVGQPFNVLLIGSDSRVGESSSQAQHLGTVTETAGQRSDVVKIVHIVPATGQASVLSIPRDTMVTVAGDRTQTGRYNRINATYGSGPDQLVQTIEANFGIPIEHVVQIDFAGFRGAVDAIGGIYLNFPVPARDAYTGLDITQTGCQHVNGGYSLAVARSRHYEYYENGYWHGDPTSDFGRIQRQNAFLKALINQAEKQYNPLTLNAFIGSVVQGVTVDSTFTVRDLIDLAREFHTFSSNSLATATLPTYAAASSEFGSLGDVLYVEQSLAAPVIQQFLGGAPDLALTPPPGPYGPVSTTTTTTTYPSRSGGTTPPTSAASSTTTTIDTSFDPTPC
jgi:LCP family protein required for cell wall assembly